MKRFLIVGLIFLFLGQIIVIYASYALVCMVTGKGSF